MRQCFYCKKDITNGINNKIKYRKYCINCQSIAEKNFTRRKTASELANSFKLGWKGIEEYNKQCFRTNIISGFQKKHENEDLAS